MSRRATLVITLVALQALALMVVLGITYWASQDVLLRYVEGLATRIARDATAYTEEYLDPASDAVQLAEQLSEAAVLDPDDRDALARYFFEVLRTQENFDGVFFGATNGDFVFVNRDNSRDGAEFRLKMVETRPERSVEMGWYGEGYRRVDALSDPADDFDPRTRPWYVAALDQQGVAWTEPYIFFTSNQPGVTVAVPVYDAETGALQGAMGVDFAIVALSSFLENLDISQRGSAALVSENGNIIAHSEEGLVASVEDDGIVRFNTLAEGEDPVLTRAADAIEGGLDGLFPGEIRLARFIFEGETWLAAVQKLRLARSPWTVVTYLPESDILAPLWRVRNTALGVALVALVATAILGLLLGRAVMGRRVQAATGVAPGVAPNPGEGTG